PLWEMHVVEGLCDGAVAVVAKIHHAIADGVAGAELLATFLDLEPATGADRVTHLDGWRREPHRGAVSTGARAPSAPRPALDGVHHRGGAAWNEIEPWLALVGSVPGQFDALVRSLRRTARRLGSQAAAWRRSPATAPSLPLSAPVTSVNRAISPHRRAAFADLAMADVQRVRDVLGGTVNDVVLAATTGSLRSFFDRRGEPVAGSLVALVPVSVRSGSERSALGNRLSALLVALPTGRADAVDRLAAVRASVATARELDRGEGSDLLQGWAEATPPAVAARASRISTERRLFDRVPPICNLVVSNVPGPPVPLYLAGTRLRAIYPLGPISEGTAVNITVISYEGRIHVGVNGCWDLVPDVDVIARGIEDSLAELVRAADRRDRPVPWWHSEAVPA
ncbi:MAG TPA: wax ester/triacylglycerol synthase family O-acyltransferase, partial [Acidimicrobiales bacterium]|nr:wax ester/triacylglycerol synthase family O-acyltransferase [Acidimicrobiales bacterium]